MERYCSSAAVRRNNVVSETSPGEIRGSFCAAGLNNRHESVLEVKLKLETELFYSRAFRNRSELEITDTELKLIAAAARMGLSKIPNTGYSTPAAIGTPSEL